MNESNEVLYIKKLEYICIELLSSLDNLTKYNQIKVNQIINNITVNIKQNNFFSINKRGYDLLKTIIFPINSSMQTLSSVKANNSTNTNTYTHKNPDRSKEIKGNLNKVTCGKPTTNYYSLNKLVKAYSFTNKSKEINKNSMNEKKSKIINLNLDKTNKSNNNLKVKNIDLSVYININNNYSRNKTNCFHKLNKKNVLKNDYKSETVNISINDIKNILDEKSKSYLYFSYDEFLIGNNKNKDSSISDFNNSQTIL